MLSVATCRRPSHRHSRWLHCPASSRLAYCLIGILVLLGTRAYASFWETPSVLDAPGTYDEWGPRLTASPDGSAWLTWMAETLYDDQVYVAHLVQGQWSPAEQLGEATPGEDRFPQIACGPDGTVWVLWSNANQLGRYAGLISHHSLEGWSEPDTVWVDGARHDTYALGIDSKGVVWVAKDEGAIHIRVYRIGDGVVGSFALYSSPSSYLYLPSVAVAPDDAVWINWKAVPPTNPQQSTEQWIRIQGSVPSEPRSYEGVVGINRAGITFGDDGTPWIVLSGRLPSERIGYGSVYASRWNGSDWIDARRISDLLQAVFLGNEGHLSLGPGWNSGGCAAWIAEERTPDLVSTVLVSYLAHGEWSAPIALDTAPDRENLWPHAVPTNTHKLLVALMQRRPGGGFHSVLAATSGAAAIRFGQNRMCAAALPSGTLVRWNVLPERAPSVDSLFWSAGNTYPRLVPLSGERTLIAAISGSQTTAGTHLDTDQSRAAGFYWLKVEPSVGPTFWLGPEKPEAVGPMHAARAESDQSSPHDILGSIRSVYPLPTTGRVTARVSLGYGQNVALRLFNSLGKLVRDYQYALPATRSQLIDLDFGQLPTGVYFLRYETKDGALLGAPRKLVVVR